MQNFPDFGRFWGGLYYKWTLSNLESFATKFILRLETYKTIGGTPFLDNGYTVFGEVIEGLELIDSICSVPTLTGDIPVTPLIILSTRIKE